MPRHLRNCLGIYDNVRTLIFGTFYKRAGIWIYVVLLLHVLQRTGIWIYVVLLLHVLSEKSATLCTCCKKAGIWVYEVLLLHVLSGIYELPARGSSSNFCLAV
jgi:hypothetical protein